MKITTDSLEGHDTGIDNPVTDGTSYWESYDDAVYEFEHNRDQKDIPAELEQCDKVDMSFGSAYSLVEHIVDCLDDNYHNDEGEYASDHIESSDMQKLADQLQPLIDAWVSKQSYKVWKPNGKKIKVEIPTT